MRSTTPGTVARTLTATEKTAPRGVVSVPRPAALILDRYRLGDRLGVGAFGTVWAARDERLDRDVAIKIVPRERVLAGRFEREARAAARLSHPAIVTLFEAAIDDDGAYLVSELVQGSTLGEVLAAGRLSDRDIVAIAISLCDALAHAHAQGIVHRDVKPSNVLVPDRPSSPAHPAKLTDFGVARVIGGDSLTNTGEVIGTAAYMAPEQAEGREANAAVDLYALALVTYEALTGVNPVRTGTAANRARRLGAHLPPLRRQRRDLPHELGRAIDRALRPRPRERGSLDELRCALADSVTTVADDPGVVDGPWRPLGQRERDHEEVPSHELAPAPAEADASHAPGRATWPERALAATATAALFAWLTAHLLNAPTLAPVAAAVAAILILVVPRAGWIALALAVAPTAAAQHHAGGAFLFLLAALVPIALMPGQGTGWPLALAAPALGFVGLAGAYPALTPRIARTAWRRAALAMTGWIWLTLAAPLAGTALYTKTTTAPAATSLHQTLHEILSPLVSSGALLGAPVWGLAALTLPWIVRGRHLAADVIATATWAALTVSGAEAAIKLVDPAHAAITIPTATVGAVAAGLVALAPSLIKAWRSSTGYPDPRPELP